MSAFGPLQKLTLPLVASGALNRICTRELLSTRGYCASRTFDVAGLKSAESYAEQRLAASSNAAIPNSFICTSAEGTFSKRVGLEPQTPALLKNRGMVIQKAVSNKAIYSTCSLYLALCI